MASRGQVPRPQCRCQSCPALGQRVHLWSPVLENTICYRVSGGDENVVAEMREFKVLNTEGIFLLVCYFYRNDTGKQAGIK